MKECLLFELIKLMENGVQYDIDEVEKMLNNGTLLEKLKNSENGFIFRSLEENQEIIKIIKDRYSFYKDMNVHNFPAYKNGLSVICCILIEAIRER